MILDGVCYYVVHFCRVILYTWRSLFVVSFLGKYLVTSTNTFLSGCIQTPVSPLQCHANNNKSFTPSAQDSQPFPLARVYQHTH